MTETPARRSGVAALTIPYVLGSDGPTVGQFGHRLRAHAEGKTDRICIRHPVMTTTPALKATCSKGATRRWSAFVDSAGKAASGNRRQLRAVTILHAHEKAIGSNGQRIRGNAPRMIFREEANIVIVRAETARTARQAVKGNISHFERVHAPAGGYGTDGDARCCAYT